MVYADKQNGICLSEFHLCEFLFRVFRFNLLLFISNWFVGSLLFFIIIIMLSLLVSAKVRNPKQSDDIQLCVFVIHLYLC